MLALLLAAAAALALPRGAAAREAAAAAAALTGVALSSMPARAAARETAAAALARLRRGNARFTDKHDDTDSRALRPLVDGQRPHTIVLACSDSRVPVEMIFDQTLGDMFVVRVAGQALDSSVLASVEYALENLDVHLVVVLGHEGCGAIAAVINTPLGASTGSPHLDALLSDIRPRLAGVAPAPPATKSVLRESAANAVGVADDLPRRSAVIKARLAAGKLIVQPALYHLGSGRVEWLEGAAGEAVVKSLGAVSSGGVNEAPFFGEKTTPTDHIIVVAPEDRE